MDITLYENDVLLEVKVLIDNKEHVIKYEDMRKIQSYDGRNILQCGDTNINKLS